MGSVWLHTAQNGLLTLHGFCSVQNIDILWSKLKLGTPLLIRRKLNDKIVLRYQASAASSLEEMKRWKKLRYHNHQISRMANIQTCHCRAGPLSSVIIMLTHECESLPGALKMASSANPGGDRGAWSLGLWHCCAVLSLGCLVCGASNDSQKTIATGQRPRMMADGA